MGLTLYKIAIIAMFSIGSLAFSISSISAQVVPPGAEACPETYVPDFNCIQKKFVDPAFNCTENKCPGDAGVTDAEVTEFEPLLEFFGTELYIESEDEFPVLINLAITTVLGIASVYAIVRGIFVGAVLRAQTTNEEEIVKYNKEFTTLILGFILAWSFILIMQIVASLLGLGSLQDLTLISDDGTGGSTIVIE